MNDIKKPSGDNIGGLIRFNFIPYEDVESIDMPIDGKVTIEVELKEGKQWYCGYGTLGSMSYTETPSENMNGAVFSKLLSAVCPQDGEENNALFNEMRNRRFIVDYTDSNGLRKLIGSIEEPLKFNATLNTQTSMPGLNAHAISFYGEGTFKAYIYDV